MLPETNIDSFGRNYLNMTSWYEYYETTFNINKAFNFRLDYYLAAFW